MSKMNWNQTQLDGRLPVTLRTANQVKAVLRFCRSDQMVATRYRALYVAPQHGR